MTLLPSLVDAILPAAGEIHGEFARETGVAYKTLIDIGGQTVLERTLSVLRATQRIRKIIVVGPPEVAAHPGAQNADTILPAVGSGPANIIEGIEWLQQQNGGALAERLLIATTDLPFITPQAIVHFMDSCPGDTDLCVPIINRPEFEQCFESFQRLFVRLKDGEWAIGCTFLINPAVFLQCRPLIEKIFTARKSPLRMAHLLGIGFIVKLLTKRLYVSDVEKRCPRLIGCAGRGITGCSPELAFDIDDLTECRYARMQATPFGQDESWKE